MKKCRGIASLLLVLAVPLLSAGQRGSFAGESTGQPHAYAQEPLPRLNVFIKYIEERTQEIHRLDLDTATRDGSAEIRNLYQEFTRISDELQDNMDSYDDQHADLRKALKQIVAKSEKWTAELNEPRPDGEYDFARKTALEANRSVHDAALQMLADEQKYFAEHKADRNKGN